MAGKKVLKARPKIYIADAAIRNAVLMDDSIMTDPVGMGKVVETAIDLVMGDDEEEQGE